MTLLLVRLRGDLILIACLRLERTEQRHEALLFLRWGTPMLVCPLLFEKVRPMLDCPMHKS